MTSLDKNQRIRGKGINKQHLKSSCLFIFLFLFVVNIRSSLLKKYKVDLVKDTYKIGSTLVSHVYENIGYEK